MTANSRMSIDGKDFNENYVNESAASIDEPPTLPESSDETV